MNKWNKYDRLMWSEFEGGEGGGSGDGDGGDEGQGEEGKGSESQESGKVEAKTFDPASFAREFGSTFAKEFGQQQRQTAPVKQLSEAEIKKALNVWEPDDEYIKEFGNLETQKAAFAKLRDNLILQADTIAQARMAQMHQQWESRFQPVQQMLTEREQREQLSKFEKTYPQFAKPELAEFRNAVGQKLQASGAFQGKDEASAFKVLADAMASAAKHFDPNFSLSPSPDNSGRTITPQSSGSGASGNENGSSSGKRPKAMALFGKLGS